MANLPTPDEAISYATDAKNLTFIAKADAAGIVLGARVPIILTSRADLVRTRLASAAVGTILAAARRASTLLSKV